MPIADSQLQDRLCIIIAVSGLCLLVHGLMAMQQFSDVHALYAVTAVHARVTDTPIRTQH